MSDVMETKQAFTGRKRRLTNRWSVKLGDVAARLLITVGGLGTIFAVSGVCLFLLWTVVPLFLPAQLDDAHQIDAPWQGVPRHVAIDEYQVLGWELSQDGVLQVFRIDTGATLDKRSILPKDAQLTAASFSPTGDSVAFGFADGAVRLGRIRIAARFVDDAETQKKFQQLKPGEFADYEGGVLERTLHGELRAHQARVDLQEPVEVFDSAIRLIDHLDSPRGPLFAAYSEKGELSLNSVREKENLLTGEITLKAASHPLPFDAHGRQAPSYLLLDGQGDNVVVLWRDGFLRRYDVRTPAQAAVAEELDVTTADGATVTAARFLLGRKTLLVGDSTGMTRAWFRVRPQKTAVIDGTTLVAAHELPGPAAPVASLAQSQRSRLAAIGYENGDLRVYYVTTRRNLIDAHVADEPVVQVLIAPKDDGLFAMADDRVWKAGFQPGHPEASFTSLFRPVWYEGYVQPEHVWQSGGGDESLEPKLGLWPLVFGTLKATFYSMLFGVPLALLAAIYTSEFVHRRTRAKIKPTIELMASLPSVVLGFLAALVFAPLVERILPTVLTAFVMVPLAFLVGAYLWQLLPYRWILRLQRWRLAFLAAFLPIGLYASYLSGPWVEQWLFGCDLITWLSGAAGPENDPSRDATGGWMLLFLPLAGVSIAVLMGLVVNPWLRGVSHDWPRQKLAVVTLFKFLLGVAATILAAWLVSRGLSLAGYDPRGSFIGQYDQRNALIVGFVMGFAIIPIIFTIADDALASVPQHLRSGSLGAGATQWQTAVRIVIPTAMSGLFSAVMIGLGRAVGETMIVLMAAGNTPIRDWNIFNGFRTLSATIAVEMPEAAKDSTHYRTLFLAALTLFALTFFVNTIAEVVRQRFRRRAYQL